MVARCNNCRRHTHPLNIFTGQTGKSMTYRAIIAMATMTMLMGIGTSAHLSCTIPKFQLSRHCACVCAQLPSVYCVSAVNIIVRRAKHNQTCYSNYTYFLFYYFIAYPWQRAYCRETYSIALRIHQNHIFISKCIPLSPNPTDRLNRRKNKK